MSERGMLHDTVHRLLAEHCPPDGGDTLEGRWAPKLWELLEDAGMHGISVPVSIGGSGGDLTDAAVVIGATGRFAAPVPIVESLLLAGWLSSEAQRPFATGPCTVGIADSTLTVQRRGSGVVIDGAVHQVPWGRVAERLLVVAEAGSGSVLIEIRPTACTIRPGENLAGEPRDTLVFADTQVDPESCCDLPLSPALLRRRAALGRTLQMAGALERVLELSLSYAQERCQFGRPIGRFQAVQHLLAQLAEETAAAVAASHGALRAVAAGRGSLEVAAAKVRVGAAAGRGAAIAHQVHGAFGMTREAPLHPFTRRLWSWRDEYGNEAEWAVQLAALVAKHGGEGLWPLLTDPGAAEGMGSG